MESDISPQIRTWPFRSAPAELRALFPEGMDDDWVVHVARREFLPLVERRLLRWRRVFPVRIAKHPLAGVVYWGAETQGLASILESGELQIGAPPTANERRTAARVSLECPIRYVTGTEPQQVGVGHTIDMSATGVSFTTESWLPANGEATLHVTWPTRLDDDITVDLCVVGQLVRTERMKAALQLGKTTFSLVS